MIRPELHAFKWSPKTRSKEDLQLVKNLEKLVKDLDLTKTQLTRKALSDFVKKRDFYSNMRKKK
jgi:predicted transcriptional regulator